MRCAFLRQDVHSLVSVDRVEDGGRVQSFRVCIRKTTVPTAAPLHWSSYPVAVSKINIIAHADLVSVVDDGSSGQGHQHSIHQFDSAAIVVEQRSQTPSDAEIQAHCFVTGIDV